VSDAATVLERCARLGEISEAHGLLVRRYATPAMREANALVGGWMRDAGLDVRIDAAGNLIGRREGGERTLVLGSHLDTVRDAGTYDGPLGVLAGLAVVERLGSARLPFAVEVVGFADEEGTRFGTTFLGSRAWAGTWDPEWAALEDEDGVTLAGALREFGGDPDGIAGAVRDPGTLLGYCEVHIEQGPVLDDLGLAVGVVDAIAGATRAEVRFGGQAGHAGTVPMERRRDAACGVAELILAAEAAGRGTPGLVATVGRVAVQPGAPNVVPGAAVASLDVRHGDDAVRGPAVRGLRAEAEAIAARRGLDLAWAPRLEAPAVAADGVLTAHLSGAIEAAGLPVTRLTSGAGHDAVALAALTGVGMLFVRCAGGLSHHPDESVDADDVAVALEVLGDTLERLAR
jgi:allantoate deiminase